VQEGKSAGRLKWWDRLSRGIIRVLTLCLVFAMLVRTGRSSRGFRSGWSLGGSPTLASLAKATFRLRRFIAR